MFSASGWPQMNTSGDGISPEDGSSDAFGGNPFVDGHIDLRTSALDENGEAYRVNDIPEGTFTSRIKESNGDIDNDLSSPIDSNTLISFSPSTSMNDLTKLLCDGTASSTKELTPLSTQRPQGSIHGHTIKRRVESDTISDISISNPPDLSHKRKKIATDTTCNKDTNDAQSKKPKKENNNQNYDSLATHTDNSKCAPVSEAKMTEGSFKDVAQAAVSNLVINAGSNAKKFAKFQSGSDQDFKSVNTSSAHVTALISHNRIGSSTSSISKILSKSTADAAEQNGSMAEIRAEQNRIRNKEHARNTRLRKKAYIEDLKRTLAKLVVERDARDLEINQEKQKDLEVREVRYRVMEEFLKLRAKWSNMDLLDRWVDILEDGFTLTLPKTNYRKMVQNHSIDAGATVHTQVLRGAAQCLEDASNVDLFMNTLVNNTNPDPKNQAVSMSYFCDREDFTMDGVKAVLVWHGSTSGVIKQGAMSELKVKGCMRATFNPSSNKLACAELHFDTGIVSTYLNTLYMHQANKNIRTSSLDNGHTYKSDAIHNYATTPSTSEGNGASSNATIISYEKGDYDAQFNYAF